MSGPLDLDAGADLARAALGLARRFAAGATLWCLAPEWPEHSRHVAVEFVHPVVMGKRALPAVSITGTDPVAELRAAAHAGDALVIVAPSASAAAAEAARRAPAWGLVTVWLGAGPRPPAGSVDHLVWIDGSGATARHDGRLVLRYHVLWELTHVCFEHPGLLADPAGTCDDGTCVTCTDEGRPGEVATLLRRRAWSRCARRAATRRWTPASSTPSPPETCSSSTPAPPSSVWSPAVADPTSSTRSSATTARPDGAARRPGGVGGGQGRHQRRSGREHPREQRRRVLAGAAAAMVDRFAAGGRLLTFGNGGSSTDAAGLAALFRRPPWGRTRPARCLVDDQAVLTALGNDVGFELVFARQLIAHGREADIALGAVDQRELAQPPRRLRSGRRPRAADRGPRRLRRRRDGPVAARAPLPRGRRRQHPPHPGDPGRAGLRPLGGGGGARGDGECLRPTAATPTSARCSIASRRSADGGPASTTRSSPWPTAPGARRRPPSSTTCSSSASVASDRVPPTTLPCCVLPPGERVAFTHRLPRRAPPPVPGRLASATSPCTAP